MSSLPTGLAPNFLQPLEFSLILGRAPHIQFHVQSANLPGISVGEVRQPTRFNTVFHTADEVQYGEFVATFICDENLKSWREIYDWLIGNTFPKEHEQFIAQEATQEGLYSDIVLSIKNSNKRKNIKVTFKNCQPSSISDIQMDTTGSSVDYPVFTVTFKYDYYEIEVISD